MVHCTSVSYLFLNCSLHRSVQNVLDFSSRENHNVPTEPWKPCHIFKELSLLANHISLPTSFMVMQSRVSLSLLFPQFFYMKEKAAKLQKTWLPLTCNVYLKCCYHSPTVLTINIINVYKNTNVNFIFSSTTGLQHCGISRQTNSDFSSAGLQEHHM